MHHITVEDGVKLGIRHDREGISRQTGMKRQFRVAGLLLRRYLVAGVIGLHEVRAGHKAPIRIAIEKMPAGGQPEILCHVFLPSMVDGFLAGIGRHIVFNDGPDLLLSAGIRFRQAAEALGDPAIAKLTADGQKGAGFVRQAEFRHEADFFRGGAPCHLDVRRAKPFHKCRRDLRGQRFDVVFTRVDHTHQRREPEGVDAKKAVAERLLDLSRQVRRRNVGETESADKRPFAFLGSLREYIQIRRVEPYRAGQFHDVSRSDARSTAPQTESNSVGSSPTGFPSILISAAPSSSRPTQSAIEPSESAISPPA